MAKTEKMTVAEALAKAALIEATLDAFEETAPETVAAMGGRDALARCSDMTCLGPMPRLDAEAWEAMSLEYEGRREYPSVRRRSAAPPAPRHDIGAQRAPRPLIRQLFGFGRQKTDTA